VLLFQSRCHQTRRSTCNRSFRSWCHRPCSTLGDSIGGSRPGNAIFVPPPVDLILDCLGALEKFLHNDPVKTPVLIKAALAHVQFETIHPFLDGNGRLNCYTRYLKILNAES